MTTPLLIRVNLSKPFVLEIGTFNFAINVELSQLGEDNIFHLVGFHSRKPMEINYEIHDKELLTIINAFEERCHLLKGAQHETTMYSNHKNL